MLTGATFGRFGMPKQQLPNADLMERYEWVYGRSMGNRDELLQRLRIQCSGMGPVMEYTGDVAASSSTGLLSNAELLTPEATTAPEQRGRASPLLEGRTSDIGNTFNLLRYCVDLHSCQVCLIQSRAGDPSCRCHVAPRSNASSPNCNAVWRNPALAAIKMTL
jgi:hypothetical protein